MERYPTCLPLRCGLSGWKAPYLLSTTGYQILSSLPLAAENARYFAAFDVLKNRLLYAMLVLIQNISSFLRPTTIEGVFIMSADTYNALEATQLDKKKRGGRLKRTLLSPKRSGVGQFASAQCRAHRCAASTCLSSARQSSERSRNEYPFQPGWAFGRRSPVFSLHIRFGSFFRGTNTPVCQCRVFGSLYRNAQ